MNKLILNGGLLVSLLLSQNILAAADPWAESYRLEALAQYEAAARSLETIISKDAKNEYAILRHGWLNYLRGNHNQAIKDYKKAIAMNSKSLDALLGIILPLEAQQRWSEASSYANKALNVAPWNYYAHIRLMIAEEGLRKWDTLVKHAQSVNSRYPSDATVLVYLARAYRWKDDKKAARKVYQQVLERVPGHIEATQFIEGQV